MSSSNQYTALGPAVVGFQTHGANIDKGAEVAGTQMGLVGTGPTGVLGHGQGDSGIGVHGQGTGLGPGVVGEGLDGGYGGTFSSGGGMGLGPQINILPNAMSSLPDFPQEVQPREIGKTPFLPYYGTIGDFFLGTFEAPAPGCALWLCVTSQVTNADGSSHAAQWCQVLLGTPVDGIAVAL